MMTLDKIRSAWNNAYYRITVTYICILVTLIFGFQMYRYFFDLPSEEVICRDEKSAVSLIPVIGALYDG